MRLGLYIIAVIGLVFLVPGLWGVVEEIRFGIAARVAPGEFMYYAHRPTASTASAGAIASGPSRASAHSRGSSASAVGESLHPVFEVLREDGTRRTVHSTDEHAFRYLDDGEPIAVLVHPDARHAPRIGGLAPRYADELLFVVIGGVIFGLAAWALLRVPPDNSVREARPWILGVLAFVVLVVVVGIGAQLLTGELSWRELLDNRVGPAPADSG